MIRRFVLVILVTATALLGAARVHGDSPKVIEITAKKFEFSPAEVKIARGVPVTLRLKSLDRVHGFLQKDLGLDATIEPTQATDVTIEPATAGRYLVICDDYCGSGHGNMKMTIVVE